MRVDREIFSLAQPLQLQLVGIEVRHNDAVSATFNI